MDAFKQKRSTAAVDYRSVPGARTTHNLPGLLGSALLCVLAALLGVFGTWGFSGAPVDLAVLSHFTAFLGGLLASVAVLTAISAWRDARYEGQRRELEDRLQSTIHSIIRERGITVIDGGKSETS